MKRLFAILILLTAVITLTACNGPGQNGPDPIDPPNGPELGDAPNLVITKTFMALNNIFTSSLPQNNVFELYNNSDETIELDGRLTLRIFRDGTVARAVDIPITGTVQPHSFFIITGSNHTEASVRALSDFSHTANLVFRGNDPVGLLWGDELFDVVGTVGVNVSFSANQTLIRRGELADLETSTTFSFTDFIGYVPNAWQYLGVWEHGIRTSEQMLAGPRLEDRYLTMPFVVDGIVPRGGGGAIPVTIQSLTDGDTTRFNNPILTGINGTGVVRYLFINTPEVPGSQFVNPEPWGLVASLFNSRDIHQGNLGINQTIHVQSRPGGGLTDTTSSRRILALVWVNGYLQQFFMAREGLTEISTTISIDEVGLSYQNVLIGSFLIYASFGIARPNGWGIFSSETAPDWNAELNRPIMSGWQDAWQPHIPLPWSS